MTRVWYACYGSNLWWDRFRCYLEGGTAPGSQRAQPGARDARPPTSDGPLEIPHRLVFAGASKSWGGGGVAFLSLSVEPDLPTRARRYLITAEQFSDVVAQEGGRAPGVDLDIDQIVSAGSAAVGSGWYDLVMAVGEHEGLPILTFTSSKLETLPETQPSSEYATTIVNGLVESHHLTQAEAHQYISTRVGG